MASNHDRDQAGDAAADHRETGENSTATDPARTSARRGPPVTTTMFSPNSRPRISSGAAACRMLERNTALIRSAAPASARKTEREPEHRRQPEADDRHRPGGDRDQHGEPVPVHPAHPATEGRGQHRADTGRGEEQTHRVRPAPEHLVGELG